MHDTKKLLTPIFWFWFFISNTRIDYSRALARMAAKRSPIGIMGKKRKPMSPFSHGNHG